MIAKKTLIILMIYLKTTIITFAQNEKVMVFDYNIFNKLKIVTIVDSSAKVLDGSTFHRVYQFNHEGFLKNTRDKYRKVYYDDSTWIWSSEGLDLYYESIGSERKLEMIFHFTGGGTSYYQEMYEFVDTSKVLLTTEVYHHASIEMDIDTIGIIHLYQNGMVKKIEFENLDIYRSERPLSNWKCFNKIQYFVYDSLWSWQGYMYLTPTMQDSLDFYGYQYFRETFIENKNYQDDIKVDYVTCFDNSKFDRKGVYINDLPAKEFFKNHGIVVNDCIAIHIGLDFYIVLNLNTD